MADIKDTSRAPVSQRGLGVKSTEAAATIGGTIRVSIDGRETKVPMGTTILQAGIPQ